MRRQAFDENLWCSPQRRISRGPAINSTQLILAFLFTLTAPMFARDNTDRLTMNNGDSMTCEIKGLDGGVLYASFDYIDGTASVDWSKVARVESTRLFVVKTEDGSVYTGALKTAETGAGRPVQIHVVQPPEQVHTMERSRIVHMVATSDKFWERFNGGVPPSTHYSPAHPSPPSTPSPRPPPLSHPPHT